MKKTPIIRDDARGTRASVTFPPALYEALERLAREMKVSLAWVVRDAADKYVNERRTAAARTKASDNRRRTS